MRLKNFVFLFVKSLNPLNYKMLSTQRKRDTLQYFFMLLIICILLGGLVSLPRIFNYPERIEQSLGKFRHFNITGVDIEMKEPITLLQRPRIVLDLRENRTLDNEWVLVTKNQAMVRKFKPSLLQLRLYETEKRNITEYSDVLQDVNRIKNLYWLLFFLLLPSLFFFVFLLNLVKYVLVVVLTIIVAYVIMKAAKMKPKIAQLYRISLFALSILVFLELVISPIFYLGSLPLLLYIVLCMLAISYIKGKLPLEND